MGPKSFGDTFRLTTLFDATVCFQIVPSIGFVLKENEPSQISICVLFERVSKVVSARAHSSRRHHCAALLERRQHVGGILLTRKFPSASTLSLNSSCGAESPREPEEIRASASATGFLQCFFTCTETTSCGVHDLPERSVSQRSRKQHSQRSTYANAKDYSASSSF